MTAPQTVAHYASTAIAGDPCDRCQRSEQSCAYRYPCCSGCCHWPDLDRHGNPRLTVVPTPQPVRHLTPVPPPRSPNLLAVVNTTVNDYRCRSCGRRTAHRSDGRRWRHRTEADNPLAPYCEGDDP